MHGRHGRRGARRHSKRRGSQDHAVRRRLCRRWRDSGRRLGQAPGGDQRQEHPVRGEAPHRPPLPGKGSAEGHRPDALHHHQGRQRRRLG